jgi:hypothetical protein
MVEGKEKGAQGEADVDGALNESDNRTEVVMAVSLGIQRAAL